MLTNQITLNGLYFVPYLFISHLQDQKLLWDDLDRKYMDKNTPYSQEQLVQSGVSLEFPSVF